MGGQIIDASIVAVPIQRIAVTTMSELPEA